MHRPIVRQNTVYMNTWTKVKHSGCIYNSLFAVKWYQYTTIQITNTFAKHVLWLINSVSVVGLKQISRCKFADYTVPHGTFRILSTMCCCCNITRGKMWKWRGHVVFHVNQSHALRTSIPHFTFRIPQFRILPEPLLVPNNLNRINWVQHVGQAVLRFWLDLSFVGAIAVLCAAVQVRLWFF